MQPALNQVINVAAMQATSPVETELNGSALKFADNYTPPLRPKDLEASGTDGKPLLSE